MLTNMRGAVPVTSDGEPTGLVVHMPFDVLMALQGRFGPDYVAVTEESLARWDIEAAGVVLETATFTEDGERFDHAREGMPCTVGELCSAALDALFLQTHGTTHKAALEKMREEIERIAAQRAAGEVKEASRPLAPTPTTGSSDAGSSPSSPASDQGSGEL